MAAKNITVAGVDWQTWAASVDRRLAALEAKANESDHKEITHQLTRIIVRQDKLKLQIEQLAKATLDEAKLSEMTAALKESGDDLEKAIKEQGQE